MPETKRRGRPPIGDRAMTPAERQRRRMERLKSAAANTSNVVDSVLHEARKITDDLARLLATEKKRSWVLDVTAERVRRLQEILPPVPAPATIPHKDRSVPRKPSNNADDALRMNSIICLEDGKAVQDLAAHLKKLGMTPDEYRRKWKLPPEYPMQPPSHILRHGATYEVDFETGERRLIRSRDHESP